VHVFDLEGASGELLSGMQVNLYQSTQRRVSKFLNCIECVEPEFHFLHAPLNVVVVWHDAGLCSCSKRKIVKKIRLCSLSCLSVRNNTRENSWTDFREFFTNDQLDALFSYLYLLQLSTCFEHHSAHHQEIELY